MNINKVITKEKRVIKASIVLFLVLSFLPVFAFDEETLILDKNSSMYKYGAIENTTSYFDVVKYNENLTQKEDVEPELLIDDSNKKVEDSIKRQNFSTGRINESINSINDKSKIQTFIIGNDLGTLKFQLVQINKEIYLFSDLYLQDENSENKSEIEEQLKLLKEQKIKVENFILDQNNKFSLLGWFVVLL